MSDYSCNIVSYPVSKALETSINGTQFQDYIVVSDTDIASILTKEHGISFDPERTVLIEPGEKGKRWDQVERILDRAFELGLARDSVIIGIGGGVVTDVTAFAASLYMRGCRLVLVPTTVLSMVDAAFGGKTGINYGGYKNMVGTFYPAAELRLIPELVRTLSERDYRSGLAEVIKHALLADGTLWDRLVNERERVMAKDPEILSTLLWDALQVKVSVVKEDLREKGVRAHLNLGHTFAHGIEASAGFGTWTHGEAVAWGIAKAMDAGVLLGETPVEYAEMVKSLLSDYGYRIGECGVPAATLIEAMEKDKKKKAGSVRFVLQRGPQETFTATLDRSILEEVIGSN